MGFMTWDLKKKWAWVWGNFVFIYPQAKGYLGGLLYRQSPTCLVHLDLWDIDQRNHNGTSSTIVWSCHGHSSTWKYP